MDIPSFVCPQTGQSLRRLSGPILSKLNEACRKKRIINSSKVATKGPLSAIWMREDRVVFYVERQQIPILIGEESIIIQDINDREVIASIVAK